MRLQDDDQVVNAALIPQLGQRPYRYFVRIGSTNDLAAAWALRGAPAGALVLAEEQTAGRGRRGRTWHAAPESSLLFSVVLRPTLPPEFLPRVTLLGAVALADALTAIGLSPRIKWPNDVLLDGRKVAGILAEGVWSGETQVSIILGCGINVFRYAVPESESANAASVEAVLGKRPDRWQLLADLLARIDFWRERIGDANLLDAWRGYNLTLGQQVTATVGDQVYSGLAEAIDDHGALLLRTEAGQLRRLLAGDVTLKKEA